MEMKQEKLTRLYKKTKGRRKNVSSYKVPSSDCCDEIKFLEDLNSLRKAGQLCDIILRANNGQEYPAHRCVLAVRSPVFKAMFLNPMVESKQMEVPLLNMEPEALKLMLDFMYSTVVITMENAELLLSSADFYDLKQLSEEVQLFYRDQIDSTNCTSIWSIAEKYSCIELAEKARDYTLKNFEDVNRGGAISTLSCEKLIELFKSDELVVKREETVMSIALHWLMDINQNERIGDFHKVLQHVNLAFLDPGYLLENVEKFPAIKHSAQCMHLIEEARLYHVLPDQRHLLQSLSFKKRKCLSTMEGIIVTETSFFSSDGHYSIYLYCPQKEKWRQLGYYPASAAIWDFSIVTFNEYTLFVAGGKLYETPLSVKAIPLSDEAWYYHPESDGRTKIASMHVARAYPGLAKLYGCIYAVGGQGIGAKWMVSVEKYSPDSNTWSIITPMPEAPKAPTVLSYKGMLYVLGLNSDFVQRYSYLTDTWNKLGPIPNPPRKACILNGCIYVLGKNHTLDCFHIEQNKWEGRLPPPSFVSFEGISVFGKCIYFFGLKDLTNAFVMRYDTDANEWAILGRMPARYICSSYSCSSLC